MATGRIERRLATILAADVVGYSRLMGVDEEGTLARLKALRRELADPKIKEHRGRIDAHAKGPMPGNTYKDWIVGRKVARGAPAD